MNSIVSPFDNKSSAIFVRNISVKNIVKSYKKSYGLDVSKYFNQLENIAIYQCELTTFKFYYPDELSGDSKFYEFFQKFDWYYNPWKWEHSISLQYIKNGYKVLEVGCGRGAFLDKISEEFQLDEATGLELNESTPIIKNKWKIVNNLIQEYQVQHSDNYDIVCSYQVLEHISDVNSFINGKINCLKRGGKLIIAVPNNESFIKNTDQSLNFPPHHMGLWDASSLSSLAQIYPIKLEKIHLEPLQEYHIDSYIDLKIYWKYNPFIKKIIRKFDKLTGKYAEIYNDIKLNSNNIIGITILAVFEKQ
jgi:2-polyprenyl-3-methyl-5-hydroxy-6-metoxy-1,4-benzoquinol methylase